MGKLYFCILGIITGFANGFFGSGGGIIAVPLLKKSGLETKESHATSIAITLPLSIISSVFYYDVLKDIYSQTFILIVIGLIGAVSGSLIMKKLPSKYLKKAFGILLIISGVRLFFK